MTRSQRLQRIERLRQKCRAQESRAAEKQLSLEEEQERMRIEREVQQEMDAMIRSAHFRQKVEALFMRYGYTREEAQTFWLRSVFGPTITEIKRDFRTLRELRRRGFTLALRSSHSAQSAASKPQPSIQGSPAQLRATVPQPELPRTHSTSE